MFLPRWGGDIWSILSHKVLLIPIRRLRCFPFIVSYIFSETFAVIFALNIFRDGEGFLFRAALGVLSLYQDQMLKETDFVLMAQFLTKLPENMESDALFARIDGITLEHLQM